MVTRSKSKKERQARDARMNERRRVLYFPNKDINDEIARIAAEDGFVHVVPGKTGEQPDVAAYIVWLHRHYLKRRDEKAA